MKTQTFQVVMRDGQGNSSFFTLDCEGKGMAYEQATQMIDDDGRHITKIQECARSKLNLMAKNATVLHACFVNTKAQVTTPLGKGSEASKYSLGEQWLILYHLGYMDVTETAEDLGIVLNGQKVWRSSNVLNSGKNVCLLTGKDNQDKFTWNS